MDSVNESVVGFWDGNMSDVWTPTSDTSADHRRTTEVTPTKEASCPINCNPWIVGSYYFTIYGNMFAYILGIPGSFLTMVVLARMRPFNSSLVWLFVMSSTDLFSLLMRLVVNQTAIYKLVPWYDWSCRLFLILANVCEQSVYYFLVGLTLERFVAVWFPIKMAVWCTKRRAGALIVVVELLTLGFSLHMAETIRANSYGYCVTKFKYRPFWNLIYQDYIVVAFMMLLPVVLVIALNILIFVRLRTASRFQKGMSDQPSQSRERQQRQINRILMAASIWFIACVMLEIVIDFGNSLLLLPDPIWIIVNNIAPNVSGVLRVYNHAANFLLYVIAARKFRSEVIKLVTCNVYVGFGKRASPSGKNPVTGNELI